MGIAHATHLNTGVHLHEVEALLLPQELDGAGTHVADGLAGSHGGITHGLAHLQAKRQQTRQGQAFKSGAMQGSEQLYSILQEQGWGLTGEAGLVLSPPGQPPSTKRCAASGVSAGLGSKTHPPPP